MDLVVEPIGRDKVQAVFIQKYQTAKLNDLSRKTLILQSTATTGRSSPNRLHP